METGRTNMRTNGEKGKGFHKLQATGGVRKPICSPKAANSTVKPSTLRELQSIQQRESSRTRPTPKEKLTESETKLQDRNNGD